MSADVAKRGPKGVPDVVLDWGPANFRALLIGPDGEESERIETPQGIQSMADGDFPGTLARLLARWRQRRGPLSVVAAGMIGSRNGWLEMPYVPTPAGPAELAAAARRLDLESGDVITFLPGLTHQAARPYPDVMRGEETQLVGFGLGRDITVVLPGTHAKWARIAGGRIERFQTFVTGEIFSTLSRHSFLAKVAAPPDAPDREAFARGLAAARDTDPSAGALLTRLFSVRTGWLAGKIAPGEMIDYLSGLVIGWEFVEAERGGWCRAGDTVAVVGDDDLVDLYRRAAEASGLAVVMGPEDAAVRGALAIAALV